MSHGSGCVLVFEADEESQHAIEYLDGGIELRVGPTPAPKLPLWAVHDHGRNFVPVALLEPRDIVHDMKPTGHAPHVRPGDGDAARLALAALPENPLGLASGDVPEENNGTTHTSNESGAFGPRKKFFTTVPSCHPAILSHWRPACGPPYHHVD